MTGARTDFGFEQVSPAEKTERVRRVFSSVAGRYDVMNDLMSFGLHRLWKRFAVHLAGVRRGARVLDLAGGTADCARLYHAAVAPAGEVVVCDLNAAMLERGRDRLLDAGIYEGVGYVQGNAEELPFRDDSFDCINIAFGLRNVTDRKKALGSMLAKLKYGGVLIVLEFSKPVLPSLQRLYDAYSFRVIPKLGGLIADDEDSYRYLVESIRMHPDQDALNSQMEATGFGRVEYYNLSGGIVAVHRAYKL